MKSPDSQPRLSLRPCRLGQLVPQLVGFHSWLLLSLSCHRLNINDIKAKKISFHYFIHYRTVRAGHLLVNCPVHIINSGTKTLEAGRAIDIKPLKRSEHKINQSTFQQLAQLYHLYSSLIECKVLTDKPPPNHLSHYKWFVGPDREETCGSLAEARAGTGAHTDPEYCQDEGQEKQRSRKREG